MTAWRGDFPLLVAQATGAVRDGEIAGASRGCFPCYRGRGLDISPPWCFSSSRGRSRFGDGEQQWWLTRRRSESGDGPQVLRLSSPRTNAASARGRLADPSCSTCGIQRRMQTVSDTHKAREGSAACHVCKSLLLLFSFCFSDLCPKKWSTHLGCYLSPSGVIFWSGISALCVGKQLRRYMH